MKIDITTAGISIKIPDDRQSWAWQELESGEIHSKGKVQASSEEIESFLTENGIDLSKPEPYAQFQAHKESKHQEQIEQAEQERLEREAFNNSRESKAYYAELKKQADLDSVDRLTDAEVMRILIEEKKAQLGIETVKQNVRAKIEKGEKDARKAIRDELQNQKK